jgi:rhamnose transport system permease protein
MTALSVEPAGSRVGALLKAREFPVLLALLVVVVGTTLSNSNFLSDQGRSDLLVGAAIIGIMAVGESFVIVMRHVDLSVGSTLGLAAYCAASVVKGQHHGGVFVVLYVGLGVGLIVGIVNGLLVSLLKLPALVVTLGTLYIVQGIQALVAGPNRINADQLPDSVVKLGTSTFLTIPWLMWITLVGVVAGSFYMRNFRSGRDLFAIGSNPPAAELVGIPVRIRTITAFAVSGACAGLAGSLFLARFGGVDANAGIGYELSVVAACVVGGVTIFGGSGSITGALLGVLLLNSIAGSLATLSVPEFWQQAVNGLLLLLAITADRFLTVRREKQAAKEVVA